MIFRSAMAEIKRKPEKKKKRHQESDIEQYSQSETPIKHKKTKDNKNHHENKV